MLFWSRRLFAAIVAVGACVCSVSAAHASFHYWRISEVFSNGSGSIQFIEFQLAFDFDDESHLSSTTITEDTFNHSYAFPADLGDVPLAGQHFLIATPGYAALKGVPAPDYTLPSNNWFSPANDNILFAFGIDSITLTPGLLPTDGIKSLQKENGATQFTAATNHPTNFAGTSGTVPAPVPEPASLAVLAVGASLSLLRRRQRI